MDFIHIRRYTRNIRTQEQIESAGAYERPKYKPQPACKLILYKYLT